MLLAKSCPRCRGDLSQVRDVGETYFSCLQCGHISYTRPHEVIEDALEMPAHRWPQPVDRSLVRRRQLRKRAA